MNVARDVRLAPFVTLRAGGRCERFAIARSPEEIAEAMRGEAAPPIILGWGSNVLPSDAGVPGLTILNLSRRIEVAGDRIVADSGAAFQDVCLRAAEAGLAGLEFSVGIPGTLGGALVSNAGAYRSEIGRLVRRIEVVEEGERRWVGPEWMAFSYRDSRLRSGAQRAEAITRVEIELHPDSSKAIYDRAREIQRKRIAKQPPGSSAGSFFKNVLDADLARALPGLEPGMRESGVVPAAVLIEACGLKGARLGGAQVGVRHANFLLNVGGASASEIRSLAHHVASSVRERFTVALEEEVLYLGDWSGFSPAAFGG